MKKEIALVILATAFSLGAAMLFLRWYEPRLFGRPKDLTVVQSSKAVIPFFENIFFLNQGAETEELLPDPYVIVRGKPLASELVASGPHDLLGFRNRAVPVAADVITIGDSQTYGRNAIFAASWPQVMQRELEDAIVYNMAIGGWGGMQYLYASRMAMRFKPRVIVLAFYAGNDAAESFRAAYSVEHWSAYRPDKALAVSDLPSYPFPPPKTDSWPVQAGNLSTVFTPKLRLVSNDTSKPAIAAGYEIIKSVIAEVDKECQAQGVKLMITIIPSKELVYAPLLESRNVEFRDDYKFLISSELGNIEALKANVPSGRYTDVVSALQEAAGNSSLYPPDWDGHPLEAGYEIIGKTVAKNVKEHLPHFKDGTYMLRRADKKERYYLKQNGKWFMFSRLESAQRLGYAAEEIRELTERDIASYTVEAMLR